MEQNQTLAKWIWKDGCTGTNITCNFRRVFCLDQAVGEASLQISAHHHVKVYINGHRLSGICSPAASGFPNTKWYLTYDIAPYLVQGENVIAATVLFIGGDGQNHVTGCPALWFTARCRMQDGTERLIPSDEHCRASSHTGYRPHLPLRELRRLTGSTYFDPGQEPRGWKEPGFDDQTWEAAVVSPAQLMGITLRRQEIPEGTVIRSWTPHILNAVDEDCIVYDAGEVLTGFVRIAVHGEKGAVVKLRYAEGLEGQRRTYLDFCTEAEIERAQYLSEDQKKAMLEKVRLAQHRTWDKPEVQRIERAVANDGSEYYCDEYVIQGESSELWQEDFTFRAFRYVEVSGLSRAVVDSIEVCKAVTGVDAQGTFTCDEDSLNKLTQACIQTQWNGIQGMLVDCPHREQAQYLGDSLMQSHLLTYNFTDSRFLLRKVLQDFADSQLIPGFFPFVAPGSYWNPMFQLRMSEYDFDYVEILWQLYWYFDDQEAIRQFYPVASRMMGYYLGLRTADGLIPKEENVFHISDWPYPRVDEEGEYLFILNCKALMAADKMKALCEFVRPEDKAVWRQASRSLSASIKAAFWSEEKGLYRDTPASHSCSKAVNALAFRAGLFDGCGETVLPYLASEPFDTRVIRSYDLLKVLFENGYKAEAYAFLTDSHARWGAMIAQGSKTIWEGFEDIESHSHAWNCYPARLLQQYVLGVSCAEAGFRRVHIAPYFPEGVRQMQGRVLTRQGVLEVAGDTDGFVIVLPEGIQGEFSCGGVCCPLRSGRQEIKLA